MAYKSTFITVAPDCKIEESEIPFSTRVKKPIHIIQYELLTENPYQLTHKDLVFQVFLIKKELTDISKQEKQELWDDLFSKGHPCLRASALTKRYGFGAHYNENGKIAIYGMETEEYRRFVEDSTIKKLAGMKSKR